MRHATRWLATAAVLGLAIGRAGQAKAGQVLYATSQDGNALVRVDTGTNSVTTVDNTPFRPDSLSFDNTGNLLYTALDVGQVRLFNTTTHADTLVAGGYSTPVDLQLDPGGNSVLVSEFNGGRIDRINLATGTSSVLGTYGGNPEGITYDDSGHLFASLGVRDGGPDKFVAQLDPVTGAILNQSAGLYSLDGLTYDSFTGKLYGASLFGGFLYEIDPTTLAATILPNSNVGLPDGIEADGMGNLFIATRSDFHIYEYNLASHTLTQETFVFSLDDLAPVSGLGANPAPEPSTLGGGALGVALALGYAWRRRRARGAAGPGPTPGVCDGRATRGAKLSPPRDPV